MIYMTQGFVNPDGEVMTSIDCHYTYLADNVVDWNDIEKGYTGVPDRLATYDWAMKRGWILFRECMNRFTIDMDWDYVKPECWNPLIEHIRECDKMFDLEWVEINDAGDPTLFQTYEYENFLKAFRKGYKRLSEEQRSSLMFRRLSK